MDRLKELLSTFFYLGYSPVASGTAGSAGAMALAFLLLLLPAEIPYAAAAIVLVVFFFFMGVPLGHWAEARYGKKDPGPFVLDEVMGFFVPFTFYFAQNYAFGHTLWRLVSNTDSLAKASAHANDFFRSQQMVGE